jgi:hypothetical protein
MNTPRYDHLDPPHWSPEQRLAMSRAQMAQALQEPVGLLLLRKILAHVNACGPSHKPPDQASTTKP